jgi:imidazoleglycerol-phosphate dehydratase
MAERVGEISRQTKETSVQVRWALDGRGHGDIHTGVGFLDHMLESLARHGRFELSVKAEGHLHIDEHHTVEDLGICMGQALNAALGDRGGLRRFGDACVPLDEALAQVAVDLSGRGMAFLDLPLSGPTLGTMRVEMVPHFLTSLATESRITLHASILRGANDHHRVEALFKALARALDDATRVDPRLGGEIPSTKGSL